MEKPNNYNTPSPRRTGRYTRPQPKNNFLEEGTAQPGTQRIQVVELWRTVRKRWIPASAVAVAVLTAVTVSTLREAPIYQSQTVILVDDDSTSKTLGLGANGSPVFVPQQRNLSTEIAVLKSSALVASALKSVKEPGPKLPAEVVAQRLSIEQAQDAKVLIVSYTDTDPKRVQAILQSLGAGYVNYSLESRRSRAANAINFIEEQLPEAKLKLRQSALLVQEFRRRYGFVDPDTYAAEVVTTKQALETEAKAAAIEVAQSQRQYQEIVRQMAEVGLKPQTALITSMLTQDDGYQTLVKKLQEIDLTYSQESLRFQSTHPVMNNLRINRANIISLLQQRAQRIIKQSLPETDLMNGAISSSENSVAQNLTTKLIDVETNLAAQTVKLYSIRQSQVEVDNLFKQIPPLQQNYTEIQRQYQMSSQEVNKFLEKLQELRIQQAEETAPWKILEPAYLPTAPIAPNIKQRFLLGLIGSCALAVLVALLLEGLDTKIKDVEEVKTLTGVPLLGTIPVTNVNETKNESAKSKKDEGFKISLFTEAIRSIALNLTYVIPKRGAKVLAVTSSVPSEGKSTTTYHVGLALADLGYRVLVVDADMHKPTIHQKYNDTRSSSKAKAKLNNAEGLSTAIATERPWQELIHTAEGKNFHILTAGPTPPSSFALLNSEKMSLLINEWSQCYDYILIDTPPLVGITDAQSLSNKVDGLILVVSMNNPSRAVVTRAVEILQSSHCNTVGLVINRVEQAQQGYYYNYYQSYYAKNGSGTTGNSSAPFV